MKIKWIHYDVKGGMEVRKAGSTNRMFIAWRQGKESFSWGLVDPRDGMFTQLATAKTNMEASAKMAEVLNAGRYAPQVVLQGDVGKAGHKLHLEVEEPTNER